MIDGSVAITAVHKTQSIACERSEIQFLRLAWCRTDVIDGGGVRAASVVVGNYSGVRRIVHSGGI